MSRFASILIPGASGEIGHGLIDRLVSGGRPIITLDLPLLAAEVAKKLRKESVASILDTQILERINARLNQVRTIF